MDTWVHIFVVWRTWEGELRYHTQRVRRSWIDNDPRVLLWTIEGMQAHADRHADVDELTWFAVEGDD